MPVPARRGGEAPTIQALRAHPDGPRVEVEGECSDPDDDLSHIELEFQHPGDRTNTVVVMPIDAGRFEFQGVDLAPGAHAVRAQAFDLSGLQSAPTEWQAFAIEEARARDEDIDGERIAQALRWIAREDNYIDSFIVLHGGEVVVERYFHRYRPGDLHELQSATKTFTAILIGIALREGLIEGLDQPLAELLPEHRRFFEGARAEITIAHALTMTTGLAWTDFGPENSFTRIERAPDSVEFVVSEPLETPPGETFHYNTGSSHLLSAVIQAVSGMSTAAYAESRLFAPLGIETYTWPALSDGVHQGGWGMFMAPRDFAKLGQLLLDEGRWEGQPIVDPEFVHQATSAQVPSGLGGDYGYQMWIDTHEFDVDDIAAARGYGGQDCFILEALDTVVVFTGDIRYPVDMAEDVRTVMNEFVIPAHLGPTESRP